MISISEFERGDGSIDWKAYKKAQVDEGTICRKCNEYIVSINLFGHKITGSRLCGHCAALSEKEKLSHPVYIRCPKCENTWSPMDSYDHDVFSDGEHNVQCTECNHNFSISTSISFTFESPELIDFKEEHDDDDEDINEDVDEERKAEDMNNDEEQKHADKDGEDES